MSTQVDLRREEPPRLGPPGATALVVGSIVGVGIFNLPTLARRVRPDHAGLPTGAFQASGARVTLTDELAEGLRSADFVYTDVWVSLGEPKDVWRERVQLLRPYQVNRTAMEKTGNPGARFMHFHDRNTTVGREIIEATGMTKDSR
jgi:ornithine carbamoyltransferase